MKTIKNLLTVLLVSIPLFGFAQEWDDIYADPAKKEPVTVQKKTEEPQKKKVVIVQGDASNMEVTANGRDVDEYNRRGNSNGLESDTVNAQDQNNYEEYAYTDRIVRFHDPESSIKITGADEVIVYVGDDLYENYNNRGWNTNIYYGMGWGSSYYPWYDPWYYGYGGWYGWGSPWSYSRWHSPWYYGWHSPWYYSRWYSPWYYGGWYDPWYYGGYYGGYWGGGYSHGFYDGYYSSLTHNRTGRSSYRRSAATSRGASSMANVSGRAARSGTRSAVSGRNTTTASSRSAVSDRSSSSVSRRSASTAPRTRIIDNSGRVYDSRNGQAIDRSGSTSRSRSINPATQSTRSSGTYNSGRSSSRTYERSTVAPSRSSSTYQRSTTTPSRSYQRTAPSRSNNSYSTPSRSSSTTRSSSTYSTPSRSSSSSGSLGGSSSSSGRSSGGSSGSSGRSGRR